MSGVTSDALPADERPLARRGVAESAEGRESFSARDLLRIAGYGDVFNEISMRRDREAVEANRCQEDAGGEDEREEARGERASPPEHAVPRAPGP